MTASPELAEAEDLPGTYALFQQPWWLNATAPGAWKAVEVHRHGAIAGRLPYRIQRRYGLTVMTMPPLTPVLGPWIRPHEGRPFARTADEIELLEELIRQLPPADLFRHGIAPELSNWLPFHWNDFDIAPKYTYRIEDLSDPDRVWSEMQSATRQKVRKAQRQVEVRTDISLERFYALQEVTFGRQGLAVPFTFDYLRRIDDACLRRGRRRLFAAEDAQGQVHAAAYVIWDERAAYYLLGGGDPELRRSSAQSLVLWEAIRFAHTVTRCFDFEGSIIRQIEHALRGFGGRLTQYLVVTRMSERLRLMYGVRRALNAAVRRLKPRRAAPDSGETD